MTWRDDAACNGSDLDWMTDEPTREHLDCCAACPVSDPCLTYALDRHPLEGIWAGTTRRERVRLRKETA